MTAIGNRTPARMTRDVHQNKINTILDLIGRRMNINARYVYTVESWRGRDSYGDVDLIIDRSKLPDNWQEQFRVNVFGKGETWKVQGQETYVFVHGTNQVNIHVAEGNASYIKTYLRYNGLSTLFSIILSIVDLEFNDKGLFLKFNGRSPASINIGAVSAVSNVLSLLEFSADNYEYSMYNERDAFTYLTGSPLFNREYFLAYANDAANSDTIAKNPIITRFVAYITHESYRDRLPAFDPESTRAKTWVNTFKRMFPAVIQEYVELSNKEGFFQLVDKKYNAEIVSRITEETGEHLVSIFESFKKVFKSEKEFNLFVVSSSPETIEIALKKHQEALGGKKTGIVVATPESVVETLPEAPKAPELKVKAKSKKKAPELKAVPKAEPTPKKKSTKKTSTTPMAEELPRIPTADVAADWPMPTPRS